MTVFMLMRFRQAGTVPIIPGDGDSVLTAGAGDGMAAGTIRGTAAGMIHGTARGMAVIGIIPGMVAGIIRHGAVRTMPDVRSTGLAYTIVKRLTGAAIRQVPMYVRHVAEPAHVLHRPEAEQQVHA